MLARRYEFYVLVARTKSHLFTALTWKMWFLPLKHKIYILLPLCNILYLLLFWTFTYFLCNNEYLPSFCIIFRSQGTSDKDHSNLFLNHSRNMT